MLSLHNRLGSTPDRHDMSLSNQYRAQSIVFLRQAHSNPDELRSDAFLGAVLMLVTNDVSAS